MKLAVRKIWVFLTCLFLIACGKEDLTLAQKGEALFNATGCRTCHRVGGVGSNAGPDLSFVGFRHNSRWLDVWMKDPQAWKPDTKMTNLRLTQSSREAMVAYLSSLKGQMYAEGERPWETTKAKKDPLLQGKLIYLRAGCVACHGVGGGGGFPNNNVAGGKIPALNVVVHTYTMDELKEKIRKGVIPSKDDPQGPQPMIRMPEWSKVLSESELEAVAAYLFTFKSDQEPIEEW